MAPDARPERVTFRVSEAEQRMLQELADADGLTGSDVVRLLIRKAHRERFGEKVSKKPKK